MTEQLSTVLSAYEEFRAHTYPLESSAEEAELRYIRETLSALQQSYVKAAQPLLDRLTAISLKRIPTRVFPVAKFGEVK